MSPQSAMARGILRHRPVEVLTAVSTPTSRSISSGKEITLISRAAMAKRKPTLMPMPDHRPARRRGRHVGKLIVGGRLRPSAAR